MDMIAIDGKKERKPHQSKEEKNKNDSGRHFKMLPYVLSGYLHNIQISGCYVHSIFSSFYLSIHRSFIQQTKKKKENWHFVKSIGEFLFFISIFFFFTWKSVQNALTYVFFMRLDQNRNHFISNEIYLRFGCSADIPKWYSFLFSPTIDIFPFLLGLTSAVQCFQIWYVFFFSLFLRSDCLSFFSIFVQYTLSKWMRHKRLMSLSLGTQYIRIVE